MESSSVNVHVLVHKGLCLLLYDDWQHQLSTSWPSIEIVNEAIVNEEIVNCVWKDHCKASFRYFGQIPKESFAMIFPELYTPEE